MPVETIKTKNCPFCAEPIQAKAVKCRFCGEFLYGDRQNSVPQPRDPEPGETSEDEFDDDVLYWSRPSLWALTGFFFKAAFFLVLAGLLMFYPIAELLQQSPDLGLSEDDMLSAEGYCRMFGVGFLILVVLIIFLKVAALKSVNYEITADRIEWARGIFSRKIDNLDMFRIIDLKLHRSFFDCVLGIGSVTLITKDKTDPQFEFEKVRDPRDLYDILKKMSLDADRKQGVIHIE